MTRADRLGPRGAAGLFALALAVLLPGIQVSFFDRDEGWYAQVCREMVETGDWLVPHYLGEVWLAKPPLTYWLVAASFKLLGVGEWQARIVPVLASSINVVLVAALAARMFGRRVGLLAGVLFITAGLPAIVGKMLLTDPVMLLCTLAAVLMHWRISEGSGFRVQGSGPRAAGFSPRGADAPVNEGEGRGDCGFGMADGGLKGTTTSLSDPQSAIRNPHFPAAAYWLFIGLGVLAKGPATLVFAGGFGLALLTTPGRRAWLWNWRYWVWMPLSLVLVVPWYAYAYHHGGDVLVKQFFWYEILSRIWGEPHGHGGPPGYYLLLSLAGLLPWTAFIPGTLIIAVSRRREDPRLRLLLIWLSVPWVILELIHSKLPHYILPCYVPLFTLLAWSTAESLRTMREWADVPQPERRVLNLWANINLAIGAGIACGGIVLLLRPGVAAIGAAAFGVGLVLIAGFGAARRLMRRRSLASAGAMAVAAMMLFYAGAGVWLFPSLESTRLSRNLADRLNATARAGERVLVCGYDEPSTFFYLHMPARPIKREAAAELAASLPGSMLLAITQDELARMSPEAAGPLKDRLPSEPLRGFNYVKMSSETIWLIRLKPR